MDAYGYGLAAYERSFGESAYGDFGGRYGFGHPPDDGDYFRQERETTGDNYNYGLSAGGPKPLTRGSTGTGMISPWSRGLPSNSSSSTNVSKTARLLPRLPRQLSLLRLPAQLQLVGSSPEQIFHSATRKIGKEKHMVTA